MDQRPWVHVEIESVKDGKVYTVPNGERIGDRRFSAISNLRIVNTGKTPALNVVIWVEAFSERDAFDALEVAVLDPENGGFQIVGAVPPNASLFMDFPVFRSFEDMTQEMDFEFTARLICSIHYAASASQRDNRGCHTIQSFIIEGDDGQRRSISLDTRDIRDNRLKFVTRPAIGHMT